MAIFLGFCAIGFFVLVLLASREIHPTTLANLSLSIGTKDLVKVLQSDPKIALRRLEYYIKNTEEDEFHKYAAIYRAFEFITTKHSITPDYCEGQEEEFMKALWDIDGGDMRNRIKELTPEEIEHIETLAQSQ